MNDNIFGKIYTGIYSWNIPYGLGWIKNEWDEDNASEICFLKFNGDSLYSITFAYNIS